MPNISKCDEYADLSFAIKVLSQKIERISELEIEVANLKNENDKSYKHRMSYLTWNLVNPISVIFIPIAVSIFVELWLNNFGKPVYAWEVESLTRSTNWTIPIVVATIAIYITNSNKLYKLIQESGDMSLFTRLRSEYNGIGIRLDREIEKREADNKAYEAKREADNKAYEAKRDAAMEKRDAAMEKRDMERQKEHEALMKSIADISNRVIRVETITEIAELNK